MCTLTTSTLLNAQDPEKVCRDMLEHISGSVEKIRDWEAFRHLFIADANFTAVHETTDGQMIARTLNLEAFVRSFQEQTQKGAFSEVEIGSKVDIFNGIAHVFQAYKVDAGEYHARGINSIQLVMHNGKWLIASVTWSNESGSQKIPEELINN